MTTSLNSARSNLDLDAKIGQPRLRTLTASTTLTQDVHDGQTLLMGASGAALTFTLPAALGTGAKFKFVVSVVNTSNYLIQVANSTDVMGGGIIMGTDSAGGANVWSTAASSDTVTLNGTTTGGVSIGDYVEVEDIKSGFWKITGHVQGSGTEATPFSAAV